MVELVLEIKPKGNQMFYVMPTLPDGDRFIHEPKHKGDAGYDLAIPHTVSIRPGDVALAELPFCVHLPDDHYGDIRPRSSTFRDGLLVHGTIDTGYRGTIRLIMRNITGHTISYGVGTRVAQLVITPYITPPITIVTDLEATERGGGGFGSTGRK
jgi:dUTP pyrophosphatase